MAEQHMKAAIGAMNFASRTAAAASYNETGQRIGKSPAASNIAERKWIQKNIKMKICNLFQLDPKTKEKIYCKCGRKKAEHIPEAIGKDNETWNVKQSMVKRPTTAFGEIEFPNRNVAKYVRVADDTEMDYMMYLLTKIWGLEPPNLLISVTGGAKHISMSKKLKDAFKKGLLKTAQSTGAWIVSGGTNHGVMKYVGEAVNMLQSSAKVVAFAIAPWGCVMNKRELTNDTGLWPAYYTYRDDGDSKTVALDPNHTHYILVDNGTVKNFGVEIEMRAALEKHISEERKNQEHAMGSIAPTQVPVVLIVVEGGPGTLETVKAAIDNNTPVVVLEGSGRAADMLAYAYNSVVEEEVTTYVDGGKPAVDLIPKLPEQVKDKLKSMVEAEWPQREADKLVQMICSCATRKNLMVIFSLTSKNSMKDIDIAILHAIMKANKDDAINQLKLALAWNRVDIAKDEIFTEDKVWPQDKLHDVLFAALVQNKFEFVELLTEHVSLGQFLTKARLIQLYNATTPRDLLYELLEIEKKHKDQKSCSLADVGEVMQHLIGDFYSSLYLRDPRYNVRDADDMASKSNAQKGIMTTSDEAVYAEGVGTAVSVKAKNNTQIAPAVLATPTNAYAKNTHEFDWPARELFIWSVLMLRKELALQFLQEEKHAIAPCLTASRLLRKMMTKSMDTELISYIDKSASEFESIAFGVLSQCFATDEARAKRLLIFKLRKYGNTTPLHLAVEADNKNFVSHQCCQRLLNNIWWGKMDELQSKFRILAASLCPPLILVVIRFKEQEQLVPTAKSSITRPSTAAPQGQRSDDMEGGHMAIPLEDRSKDEEEVTGHKVAVSKLGRGNKFVAFYNAPNVTFFHNCVMYILFLLLFSYMMLCDFHPEDKHKYTPVEIIVAVWVITLIIEEFRQLMVAETNNFKLKLIGYISDLWNIVDIISVSLFIIGYALRVADHNTIGSKINLFMMEHSRGNKDAEAWWLYFHSDFLDTWNTKWNQWSRVFLSISLMTFYFRILNIFSVFRILGPKLVMIGKMMYDLSSFAVIMCVFIVSFGILQQSILYPNEPFTIYIIYYVFRKSFWQVNQQLFLDDIEGNIACTADYLCTSVATYLNDYWVDRTCADGSYPIGINGTCADNSDLGCYNSTAVPLGLPVTAFPEWGMVFCYDNSSSAIPKCDQTLPRCAETNPMVPALLGVYVIFTQILMINMLIAMFSYTFNLVQENTDLHWKYQRYFLIKEYYVRPPTPPPLIIFNHVILLLRYLYRKCQKQKSDNQDDFQVKGDQLEEKQLADWERMNFDEYTREQQSREDESLENRVAKSGSDLDQIISRMDTMSGLPQMQDRIEAVEKKMTDTVEALNWIMKNLSKSASSSPPLLKTVADEQEEKKKTTDKAQQLFNEWKEKKNGIVHIKSRSSPYMGTTKVKRAVVPTVLLYWEIDWPSYEPISYTADQIISKPSWADEDITKMSKQDKQKIKFNQMDGSVNRISIHGPYKIDNNGFPLNPFGRSGICGRGLLGRWGPNHALDAIVSRWKEPEETRKGKRVLEFIAVKRKDVSEWAIPGSLGIYDTLQQQETIKEKVLSETVTPETLEKLQAVFSNSKIVYEGYVDDQRNTDNAWIETRAVNFHDSDQLTKDVTLDPGDRLSSVAWLEVSSEISLFAGHTHLIERLANLHDAAF